MHFFHQSVTICRWEMLWLVFDLTMQFTEKLRSVIIRQFCPNGMTGMDFSLNNPEYSRITWRWQHTTRAMVSLGDVLSPFSKRWFHQKASVRNWWTGEMECRRIATYFPIVLYHRVMLQNRQNMGFTNTKNAKKLSAYGLNLKIRFFSSWLLLTKNCCICCLVEKRRTW